MKRIIQCQQYFYFYPQNYLCYSCIDLLQEVFIHVAALSSKKIRIMHFIQYSYRFLNVSKSRY